jgi:hypothetical protein
MGHMDDYYEPPWVNDREWTEVGLYECENEGCNFSGDIEFSCVGQASYDAYYECPDCGTDGYKEKYNDGDY